MTTPEEQIRIEAAMAKRLMDAPNQDRGAIYGSVYDEIYAMHISRNEADDAGLLTFGAQPFHVDFVERLSKPGDSAIEVGCGSGYLSIEVARRGRRVLGLDVAQVIIDRAQHFARDEPDVTFERTSGTSIPAADDSADLVFSVEVVEHLHPDDVAPHLREVFRVLKPGGRYWMLTPNGSYPTSVSARWGSHHEEVGGDIHLKEWTYAEMIALTRSVGFRRPVSPWRGRTFQWLPLLPARLSAIAERFSSPRVAMLAGTMSLSLVVTKP